MLEAGRLDVSQGPTAAGLTLCALSRYGERQAFSGHGGVLTYAQALALVAQYQVVFTKAGLERGQRIALLTANRADAWLASVAASALGLCTNSLHPLGSLADHLFALDNGRADDLIVDAHAYPTCGGELHAQADGLRQVFTVGPAQYGIDLQAQAASVGAASARVLVQPGDLAMLGYTGGTTGKSKGAMRRHPCAVASNGLA
ncbi:MAG: fatty-acyl-CoA synthase [Gammaproteobacteria bacterium]|jgi:fatty-acyl-CoA synthase